jgi:hypothetical protein
MPQLRRKHHNTLHSLPLFKNVVACNAIRGVTAIVANGFRRWFTFF